MTRITQLTITVVEHIDTDPPVAPVTVETTAEEAPRPLAKAPRNVLKTPAFEALQRRLGAA